MHALKSNKDICIQPITFMAHTLLSICNICLPVLVAKGTALFSKHTKTIVWGMQTRAVQGMMDFDYVCSREEPSVAAMVYPFT